MDCNHKHKNKHKNEQLRKNLLNLRKKRGTWSNVKVNTSRNNKGEPGYDGEKGEKGGTNLVY